LILLLAISIENKFLKEIAIDDEIKNKLIDAIIWEVDFNNIYLKEIEFIN
jgi:hypothetical protein